MRDSYWPWWKALDWHVSRWLLRVGIWQAKEEGGWFDDCRLTRPRLWFRGRVLPWGEA